jgi:hypothetical protein
MLPIYLVSAIVAGGFTLFTAVASAFSHGADGGDHSHDSDAGNDHGDDHPGFDTLDFFSLWLPFARVRFWLYAIATFGVAGSILTLGKISQEPITLQASLAIGFAAGWVVNFIYAMLQKHLAGGSVGQEDFVGTAGRMLVGSRPNQVGKVRVTVKGELIDLLAVSDDGSEIAQDERVLVVNIENDRARVVRIGEFFSE